jgi:Uma2 family endonuclease
MTAAEKLVFTAQDYLTWEATQPIKHEFVDGEMFAMAGASESHVTVSGNVFATLRNHLRGTPCRSYIADMKLHVEAVDAYFYPDVFVTCSSNDARRKNDKSEPSLIIEVLSPSTAAYDRGLKFAYYRNLQSLHEYVLIDPERYSVEVYRRNDDGLFVLHPYVAGDSVHLASVNLHLGMDSIYEDATPPTDSAEAAATIHLA